MKDTIPLKISQKLRDKFEREAREEQKLAAEYKLKKRPGAYESDIVFLMQSLGYDCTPNNYVDVFNAKLPLEERKAIFAAVASSK